MYYSTKSIKYIPFIHPIYFPRVYKKRAACKSMSPAAEHRLLGQHVSMEWDQGVVLVHALIIGLLSKVLYIITFHHMDSDQEGRLSQIYPTIIPSISSEIHHKQYGVSRR